MQYAVERLWQEYDFVLMDMSPAMKLNKGNVPLHALSSCSQMTIVTASLGHNDEEALCASLKHLKESGHNNIRIVISQHHFEPLGERVLRQLSKHKDKFPKLSNWLSGKLLKQSWLFHNH
jgi:Mrp family chromosome partitioning ATPase